MLSTSAAVTVALALLLATGDAAAAFTSDVETNPDFAVVNVYDDEEVKVYDYTTVGTTWTPLIIATIEEFNAVSPAGAPQLVYVTASGDADCLDLWSCPPSVDT